MQSLDNALSLISSLVKGFAHEFVALEEADGRILSKDITADRNYPPFNRAAMDGYAIMQSDWKKGIRKYKVAETILAGQASQTQISSGYCYKIMTGAATPPVADVIIRREDANELDQEVELRADDLRIYQNISREGEDTKKGDLLVKAPVRCSSQIISLLAATGNHLVSVYALPSVSVITTGDEVVPLPAEVTAFQIRNSNQFLLKSLLKKWQISAWFSRHVADEINSLTEALSQAITSDITIINGGVSAGDADYVPAILKSLGVREIFHKVAIRPGKPLWVGQTSEGKVVFALPGNPLSCLTTFSIFVESFLFKSMGFESRPLYKLPILQDRSKKHPLTEFFPVSLDPKTGGLQILPFNGSGDITAGLFADGLAVQPDDCPSLLNGDLVAFYPFRSL
ncbi:molybdopterin molybdotransferase [Arcticibacter pallidicorallinus]|uniref:Molybdopterin molybdenumtransferase n=1 Tax=Arcticibacter pallidicorallinus TaxID=1259464 RepID=A0A2T0U4F9_9SPHI|nr:molybdopterin molybdotransferase MoeA [Arcticibacter pallidicorallinus]PRY52806.1 molybdopterin molybdotransferase [Arcticibacter pallidicorallinus]